eukprot:14707_1
MTELTLPPQSLLLQSSKCLELVSPTPKEGGELTLHVSGNGSNSGLPVSIENGGDVSTLWSADGSRLAISCMEGTYLLRSNEKGEFDVNGVVRLPPPRPKVMHWSPKGTFLVTWTSPELVVLDGKTGEAVLRLPQKIFRSSQWPSVQVGGWLAQLELSCPTGGVAFMFKGYMCTFSSIKRIEGG